MFRWIILVLVLTLTACQNQPQVLPDLAGQTQEEIEVTLEALDLEVDFIERTFVTLDESREFIEYGQLKSIGDPFEPGDYITVIVSASKIDESIYYVTSLLPYDGPRLLESFFDFPYVIDHPDGLKGGGKVFEVTLQDNNGCVDGDTARFEVPEDFQAYTNTPFISVRFLNFDTAETFDGGEEVFGKPASVFTCDALQETSAIYLQTDPGDFLFDRYGRTLAWVWIEVDGNIELLNYHVVRAGLGEVMYLYGAGETDTTVVDGLTYTEWMYEAERLAENESLGIHGDLLDYYWDYENDAPNPYTWP